MRELSKRLGAIKKDQGEAGLEEAREIIFKLRSMNQRWNIGSLDAFLKERQKELFF